VSDEEWAFVAPYLTLRRADAPQRDHPLREVFNGLRWLARTGAQWRMLPHDLPPWYTVSQQAQRWRPAGLFFEAIVHDLRRRLRGISRSSPIASRRSVRIVKRAGLKAAGLRQAVPCRVAASKQAYVATRCAS
jgi:transposase